MLYGMEAWKKLSRVEIQNIEKIQGKALKGVFSLPITTPYIGLIIETGVWPAEQRINGTIALSYAPIVIDDSSWKNRAESFIYRGPNHNRRRGTKVQ